MRKYRIPFDVDPGSKVDADFLTSHCDAKGTGTMTSSGGTFTLPTGVTLANQLAICEFTIKNSGDTEITGSITGLTLSDGTNTYTVSRAATAGPIYVAMQPVTRDKTLSFVANAAASSVGQGSCCWRHASCQFEDDTGTVQGSLYAYC